MIKNVNVIITAGSEGTVSDEFRDLLSLHGEADVMLVISAGGTEAERRPRTPPTRLLPDL